MLQNKMALQQFAICAGGSIGLRLLRSQKRTKLRRRGKNRCGQGLGRLKPAATAHGSASLSASYPSKPCRPTYLVAQVFSGSSERSARQGTTGRWLRAMLINASTLSMQATSATFGSQGALVVHATSDLFGWRLMSASAGDDGTAHFRAEGPARQRTRACPICRRRGTTPT